MKHKRKPITPREMEAAYRLCLERERIRERDWRETKQGAFESSFLCFDMEAEESLERERSTSWLSDRGRGARQIRRVCDPQPKKPTRLQLINKAAMRIKRNLPECLEVFWLVVKNETNRKESIWQLMHHGKYAHGGPQKPSTLHGSKKS